MVLLVWLWCLAWFISWLCKCWCWHEERGGGEAKKHEPSGTAAGFALGAARRCSWANLIAGCCQKPQSNTLLPLSSPPVCSCRARSFCLAQLWSPRNLAAIQLSSLNHQTTVVVFWQHGSWNGSPKDQRNSRAKARAAQGVHSQQRGGRLEGRTELSPFSSNDLLVWLSWIF